MRHRQRTLAGIVIAAGLMAGLCGCGRQSDKAVILKELNPVRGRIEAFISTTGTVLPKNRLEIKPPVNGRIEEILVKEGERVQAGQTLALMSSTERAAMLDAARGQGPEQVKYWEEVYKPITLVSPAAGEVIVAKTQPGQTVTVNEAVIVLSDKLIVRAQVDETDIGKINPDTPARIKLDAYPDVTITARVDHIYYESQLINNVTIYEVDLAPENVPSFLRSGMNASVDFIDRVKENVLTVPLEAIQRERESAWVYVREPRKTAPVQRPVTLGMIGDKEAEIVSGLSEQDRIVIMGKQYALPNSNSGKNPFMPSRRR